MDTLVKGTDDGQVRSPGQSVAEEEQPGSTDCEEEGELLPDDWTTTALVIREGREEGTERQR